MLTRKQIKEIKEHLGNSQSPVFFFDNDLDGLCSFLLLQRFLGRGKGVQIKSFPCLTGEYFRKVNELNADYIFILDKPLVSAEFLENARQFNIPVVWIDHHDINRKEISEFVNYYNPLLNKNKTNEPVTALCYEVTERKEDLWIAVIGCIFDRFIPGFYKEFREKYPDLSVDSKDAFAIFYESRIGMMARVLNFALKDRVTNVVGVLKFLMKIKSPYELSDESGENFAIYRRFNQINPKYKKLLQEAVSTGRNSGKLLFFQFSWDLSISADLANELIYKFPEKIVVVAYIRGMKANISVRGKKIKERVLNVIKNLENATGGGHEDAVGAKINTDDLEKFRNELAG